MAYFGLSEYPVELDDEPILPLAACPEYLYQALPTFGGDLGQPSDLYSSLEPDIALGNARAVHYALTRVDVTNAVKSISTGHDHLSETTLIDWRPLCVRWFGNGLGAATRKGGYAVVDVTTFKSAGWAGFVIPAGLTRVVLFPRFLGQIPAPGSAPVGQALQVRFTIYAPPALGAAAASPLASSVVAQDGSTALTFPRWVEGEGFPLASLPALTNGERLAYVNFEARVTANDAVLVGAALGLRAGP